MSDLVTLLLPWDSLLLILRPMFSQKLKENLKSNLFKQNFVALNSSIWEKLNFGSGDTDFEKAVMNTVKNEFPGIQNKCCNFHLCQSTYRRIQSAGLATSYGTSQEFSLLMQYIPALALLSDVEIPDAFDQVKQLILNDARDIVN